MKLVKPFNNSLSKNLGALLFYTAVLSGTLAFDNKAFALEAPDLDLPPSLATSTSNGSEKSAVLKDSKTIELNVKKENKIVQNFNKDLKREAKNEVEKEKTEVVNDEKSKVSVSEEKLDSEKEKKIDKNTVDDLVIPPDIDNLDSDSSNVLANDGEDKEEFTVSNFEIRPEKEIKEITKRVEIDKKEKVIKVFDTESSISKESKAVSNVPIKEESKENKTNKIAEEKVEINLPQNEIKDIIVAKDSKNIDLTPKVKEVNNIKESKKLNEVKKDVKETKEIKVVNLSTEKSEVKDSKCLESKSSTSNRTKKVSKKVRVDESYCPPECDWFSYPLVFVKDANGKMVLKADKTAPKIVLKKYPKKFDLKVKDSKKSVNEISKANVISKANDISCEKLNLNKEINNIIVCYDNDNTNNIINNENVVVAETKIENDSYDKSKFVEAPEASIYEVIEDTTEVVDNNEIVENKVAKASINDFKPITIVEETKERERTLAEKPAKENRLFAEAVEKMSKIKELRSLEFRKKTAVFESDKPGCMVRMNKLVSKLIQKSETGSYETSGDINTNIIPQAPPEKKENNKCLINSNKVNNNSNCSSRQSFLLNPIYSKINGRLSSSKNIHL